MTFSALRNIIFSGVVILSMTACQPVTGDSLLNDKKAEDRSLTLDKTPKSEELYLKAFNPTVNANGGTKVEVTGECYVSTYPLHRIVAQLGSTGSLIGIVDINPATAVNSNTASCHNGRFTLSIDAGALASGQHSIRLILQAFEMNGGAPVTNESQGATTIRLNK